MQHKLRKEQDCKIYVEEVFGALKGARNTGEVDAILSDETLAPNKVDVRQFPRITFDISQEQIREMYKRGILNQDHTLAHERIQQINDPLVKLLYALAWKNGDLPKIKHIIKGVLGQGHESVAQAFVFRQFGRHLADKQEPIVDQHVLRAFGIHRSQSEEECKTLRKMSIINKQNAHLIQEYSDWLRSEELTHSLRASPGYSWHVDQVLFALGKAVKV